MRYLTTSSSNYKKLVENGFKEDPRLYQPDHKHEYLVIYCEDCNLFFYNNPKHIGATLRSFNKVRIMADYYPDEFFKYCDENYYLEKELFITKRKLSMYRKGTRDFGEIMQELRRLTDCEIQRLVKNKH